jgi:hypothetical protein
MDQRGRFDLDQSDVTALDVPCPLHLRKKTGIRRLGYRNHYSLLKVCLEQNTEQLFQKVFQRRQCGWSGCDREFARWTIS